MLREELEWFKRPRTRGVVFEVVRVDVDLLEQLDRDAVVSAFTEVHSVLAHQRRQPRPLLLTKNLGTHLEVSAA